MLPMWGILAGRYGVLLFTAIRQWWLLSVGHGKAAGAACEHAPERNGVKHNLLLFKGDYPMQHIGFLVVSNATFKDFRYPLMWDADGCYWVRLDRSIGFGVCNQCGPVVMEWDNGRRS